MFWNSRRTIRAVIPPLFIFILFAGVLFFIIIPQSRSLLFHQIQKNSEDNVDLVLRLIEYHHSRAEEGEIPVSTAKQRALDQVRNLRYGPQERNYFWICDYQPILLMHPYRSDLEGKNVGSYTDPEGNKVFQEMVELVKKRGEGYTDYQWQFHGDRSQVVSKRSYVEGFEPWQWIVGTGIYLSQAEALIDRLIRSSTLIALIALAVIGFGAFFLANRSIRLLRIFETSQANLELANRQYRDLVETMNDGLIVLDRQWNIRYTNKAFQNMLDYTQSELAGKHLDQIVPVSERTILDEQLEKRKKGEDEPYEITFKRKNGKVIECVCSPKPIFTREGLFHGSFAVITDVNTLKSVQKDLEAALEEKNLLLREVHHRVKNNLQIISSMLHLQQESVTDQNAWAALRDSQYRIETLALVHSFLYSSEQFGTIPLPEYINDLVASLSSAYDVHGRNITISADVADIEIGIDQTNPLALIITELVTNCLKHAFPERDTGSIEITVAYEKEQAAGTVTVSDNGIGIQQNRQDSGSIGMMLVHAMVDQLNGSIEVHSNEGTVITITAPLKVKNQKG
ncbi:MAG: cache domain-containing protein [Spirochaetales bacterium]|nr:cache domain-containing protein [Spirochaetales bacterium]MCF7936981.1 cache domain-containing protein [Spirochaetales bacterium]